jgi:predicted DNA-binding transcriptional regulator AlpA
MRTAAMAKRFVRFNEGLKLIGVSRSEAYRRQKTDPDFPKIVKPLGEGTKPSAFVDEEIAAYQAARIAERDAHTA